MIAKRKRETIQTDTIPSSRQQIFYMWPRREGWDYELVDAYQKRGGGLIVIHMALMQGSGEEWSKRIGLAWDLKRDGTK